MEAAIRRRFKIEKEEIKYNTTPAIVSPRGLGGTTTIVIGRRFSIASYDAYAANRSDCNAR